MVNLNYIIFIRNHFTFKLTDICIKQWIRHTSLLKTFELKKDPFKEAKNGEILLLINEQGCKI